MPDGCALMQNRAHNLSHNFSRIAARKHCPGIAKALIVRTVFAFGNGLGVFVRPGFGFGIPACGRFRWQRFQMLCFSIFLDMGASLLLFKRPGQARCQPGNASTQALRYTRWASPAGG